MVSTPRDQLHPFTPRGEIINWPQFFIKLAPIFSPYHSSLGVSVFTQDECSTLLVKVRPYVST
jgi:hypothetical protein